LSIPKYREDENWLKSNKGFSPQQAKEVVAAIGEFLNDSMGKTLTRMGGSPPDQGSWLGSFEVTADDIAVRLPQVPFATIDAVLEAFRFPDDGNPTFTGLHEFNSANAFPILAGEGAKRIVFLYASLTEALYETPFYWMGADKAYEPTAMAHR